VKSHTAFVMDFPVLLFASYEELALAHLLNGRVAQ
jgi:hypothetical protein